MVKLQFTLQTQSDLRNIHEYIALDSPANAKRFVKELKTRLEISKKYPEMGHLVLPERFKIYVNYYISLIVLFITLQTILLLSLPFTINQD